MIGLGLLLINLVSWIPTANAQHVDQELGTLTKVKYQWTNEFFKFAFWHIFQIFTN
jgi:hypothetical protein